MKTRLFAILATLCLLTVTAWAQNAAEIRAHMAERLPAIDALKAREAVGENNRGLLEVRGQAADAGALVAEENRDRQAAYAIIAKETGATPDSVGKTRAKQIAANSRAGVWVQDESGKWNKK